MVGPESVPLRHCNVDAQNPHPVVDLQAGQRPKASLLEKIYHHIISEAKKEKNEVSMKYPRNERFEKSAGKMNGSNPTTLNNTATVSTQKYMNSQITRKLCTLLFHKQYIKIYAHFSHIS